MNTPSISLAASSVYALNVDLHCHSVISDGLLTPTQVAERAHANGVQIWSLTDHDELSGQSEAAAAAQALGMNYVGGVEISVSWQHETLHIVGLKFDVDNTQLQQGLAKTRSGRGQRAQEIALQLEAVGIPGAFQGSLAYAGNPDLISRTHFARFLVERGVCRNMYDVFNRYLVAGKPGYVPIRWASLSQAITWIRDAGGIAVIAHPGRYKLSEAELCTLFDEFKQLGGAGLEVITGSHSAKQYKQFARYAQQFGFLASRGSDFHGPGESPIEPGALPPLPENLVPVWHDWEF